MFRKTASKIMPYVVVLLSLAVAAILFFQLKPEKLLRMAEQEIVLADLERDGGFYFVGKKAGADIPRLTSADQFADVRVSGYFTAEPVKVVSTGIYVHKNWEDTSEYRSVKSGKRVTRQYVGERARVTDQKPLTMEYYHEYYLIQLSDGSWIPALFDSSYAAKIEQGSSVTLPIGERSYTERGIEKYLSPICETYGVSTEYTLYCFDDEWYEKNRLWNLIIRIAAAVICFFVLAVPGIMLGDKLLGSSKEKTSEREEP